ncbi:hypothetical protein NQ314_009329 [Rhamnusium bicolor]|uniref:MAT1 C-terminal CAK anchor domain-containing protein n=1 Tax=Rhamnusium bicolor TaxID=1586634 RepID=A0AAV8Y376_9CUCU|nr:hypothetical protein NQ314_009329 [Rhamnusium bicolor]
MFSNADAKNIVDTFAQQAQKAKEERAKPPAPRVTQFSTGIQFGRQTQPTFMPLPVEEGPLYSYKPFTFPTDGPLPPSYQDIIERGFINHVRVETEQERAGGFRSTIACTRALQEALMGLFHTKKTSTVH